MKHRLLHPCEDCGNWHDDARCPRCSGYPLGAIIAGCLVGALTWLLAWIVF
jgi:hypothetical protein